MECTYTITGCITHRSMRYLSAARCARSLRARCPHPLTARSLTAHCALACTAHDALTTRSHAWLWPAPALSSRAAPDRLARLSLLGSLLLLNVLLLPCCCCCHAAAADDAAALLLCCQLAQLAQLSSARSAICSFSSARSALLALLCSLRCASPLSPATDLSLPRTCVGMSVPVGGLAWLGGAPTHLGAGWARGSGAVGELPLCVQPAVALIGPSLVVLGCLRAFARSICKLSMESVARIL